MACRNMVAAAAGGAVAIALLSSIRRHIRRCMIVPIVVCGSHDSWIALAHLLTDAAQTYS